tara:strand:- start:670 stop:846 length:177 start_codon:yes stop_codon:yes gene_type:complete
MGNKQKKKRKRWVHRELDDVIIEEARKWGTTELEIMKSLGLSLKKKKKKKEWRFDFKI